MRRPKSILTLLLMAILVTSFWGHGAFVLCFGDDGHVAVEPVAVKHGCEPAAADPLRASPRQPVQPGVFGADSPCGSCLDIPFPVSTGMAYLPPRESRGPRNHPAVQPRAPYLPALVHQDHSQGPLPCSPPPYGNPVDLLSTTILLI